MKIKIPTPQPLPRKGPDVAHAKDYIVFLKGMQKVKIPRNRSESKALANDALIAAFYLARVSERINDFGACVETQDSQILELLETFAHAW